MAYSRTIWVNDSAPAIDAVHLNNIEEGLVALDTGKQPLLISGTNIKTVNGSSILGSGNIVVPLMSLSGTTLTITIP